MTWALAIARRRVREINRSRFDNLLLVVGVYVIFIILMLTVESIAGGQVDASRWSSFAVGYVTFLLVQQSLQTFNAYVGSAAATGSLELLALSRPGLSGVFLVEFIYQLVIELCRVGIALALIVVTTGHPIEVDPRLFLVLPPTLAATAGLGLGMAGATLAFKRTSGLAAILSLLLLGLIAAPVDRVPALRLLPVADGGFMLRAIASGDVRVLTSGRGLLVWAVGAVYLAIGVTLFRHLERVARRRGVLGHV